MTQDHSEHGIDGSDSKADRVEKRAENKIQRESANEDDRESLVQKEQVQGKEESSNREKTVEQLTLEARQGRKAVGDATKALGFSPALDGDSKVLLPGKSEKDVAVLNEISGSASKEQAYREGGFGDPDELVGIKLAERAGENTGEKAHPYLTGRISEEAISKLKYMNQAPEYFEQVRQEINDFGKNPNCLAELLDTNRVLITLCAFNKPNIFGRIYPLSLVANVEH